VQNVVEPAGPCGSTRNWPLDVLARATYDERQEKFALLLEHGIAIPVHRQAEVFAWFPLTTRVVNALIARGIDPTRPTRWDGQAVAPLTAAIGMMRETFPGRPFEFNDDEILAYVRALLAAGAKPGDTEPGGLDAWQALAQTEASLREFQDGMQAQQREAKAALDKADPARRQALGRRMGLQDEETDLSRAALVRQVREALENADAH